MPDGDPAVFGRWRSADATIDPSTGSTPTQTPGSRRFITNVDGTFSPDNLGVFAVHMALMHTGRVLMFSGHYETSNLLHRSWSWDPTQTPTNAIGSWVAEGFINAPPWTIVPGSAEDPDSDVFCAHHVFLPDGRLMVLGGDHAGSHTNSSVHLYDPLSEQWTKLADHMQYGRWYPTSVLLPDGSVLVFSGVSSSPGAGSIDQTIEHLQPPDYSPKTVTGGERFVGGVSSALRSYPSLHLVPGGKIFYTFASWGYGGATATGAAARIAEIRDLLGDTSSFMMRPNAAWADSGIPEGEWEYYGIAPTQKLREEGTAVLLPPAQEGKILVIGGGWWDVTVQQGTPTSCEVLSTQTTTLTWTGAGQMHHPRVNANAVLLPDGKVLIFGGHDQHKRDHDSAHLANEAEIYDPAMEPTPGDPSTPFTLVAIMHATRLYHATGFLLPDATVLVAGGEEQHSRPIGLDFGSDQRSMEIYEPPYCHQGPRPAIDGITDTGNGDNEIHYGGGFTIQTPNADDIKPGPGGVILMRPGCTTHHTDSEQRLVHIEATTIPGGLRVKCPVDPSIAPPGYYMVFIVDNAGRPCERAEFVRLDHCAVSVDDCVAPVFEKGNLLPCLLLFLITPLVLIAFIVGLLLVIIINVFIKGTLARYICNIKRFLFRVSHCSQGNTDPCLNL